MRILRGRRRSLAPGHSASFALSHAAFSRAPPLSLLSRSPVQPRSRQSLATPRDPLIARAGRAGADSGIRLTFGRAQLQATQAYFSPAALGQQVASASTAEEELWLAMRGLPPAAAALVQLRDAGAEPEGTKERGHLEGFHAELRATAVYRELASATAGLAAMRVTALCPRDLTAQPTSAAPDVAANQ